MMQPSVTVLMPVYNAERFLKEAIDSILQQTFTNLELLIINDGSTDSTLNILQQYNDSRIRVITNDTNKGISYSLNLGIEESKTSLIARMDADDISYPERIEKQYAYMQNNPDCALLNTWAREITEEGKTVRIERFKSDFYYYNMTFECWTYHPTIMYRKEAVIAVGGYGRQHSEDYTLFCNLLRRYKIYNLEEVLLDYRISQSSLHSVTNRKEYEAAHQQQVIENIQFFTGIDNSIPTEIIEALKWNFEPLLKKRALSLAKEFLNWIDIITEKILEKDNPNRNTEAIRAAAAFKKQYAIAILARQMPLRMAIQLLIQTGNAKTLILLIRGYLAKRINP